MSTEQSEAFKEVANSPGETTQQATTPTPTTAPKLAKNPKRVAAGKAVAERTRLAREQQKKAAAEAAIIIANNKTKASNTVAAPEPTPPSEYETPTETPKSTKVDNSSLSTTQWIGVISIVVSLIGIYYKREEFKAAFSKKKTPEQWGRPHTPSDEPQPARATRQQSCQPRGVKHLD